MLNNTDVAPEEAVDPGLCTVKFVPTAVGLCMGIA